MHYLGVASLACLRGESWPTPHTRATFFAGGRERGHILFYLSGPVYLLAAFRFVCAPKGPLDLEICTLCGTESHEGIKR